MKTYHKILFVLLLLLPSALIYAQDKKEVKTLIEEGIALNDSGKYDAAIAKYKGALKLDSGSLRAQYELSYTLSTAGRPQEAIPYLLKVAPSNDYAEAYDLLANIYDDAKDFEKAIAFYKQGLIAFPKDQRLHFNLGISYLRQKKYPEAEQEGIAAIKLDPKHASSQRLYALATYNQNKRDCALLAWCNFILIEPQTKRSVEGYNYIHKILNYGLERKSEKEVTVHISDKELGSSSMMISMATLTATDNKKNLSPADSLALQLTSVFQLVGELSEKKKVEFYSNYYADYFKKMADSGNVPAFARMVYLSVNKEESLKWFKENDKQLTELDKWIAATEKKF
ncbi:MAG TPA: tetratricopeptide repeat protein [Mucilaginibacter sp.]|nr:tetratricopeptide repeat protein [Mucilaginibacter sp.]